MTSLVNHAALQGLDSEQIAELALYGLQYRALGAKDIDFSKPERLDVYWTGERMLKKVVKEAVKSSKAGDPQALKKVGVAIGHLQALCNCSVIDQATYMEQWQPLLDLYKTKNT